MALRANRRHQVANCFPIFSLPLVIGRHFVRSWQREGKQQQATFAVGVQATSRMRSPTLATAKSVQGDNLPGLRRTRRDQQAQHSETISVRVPYPTANSIRELPTSIVVPYRRRDCVSKSMALTTELELSDSLEGAGRARSSALFDLAPNHELSQVSAPHSGSSHDVSPSC